MKAVNYYDPSALRDAKRASREQDAHDLRAGHISPAELKARNSLLGSIEVKRISFRPRQPL